jgi:CRP-like cAMP-binding protein
MKDFDEILQNHFGELTTNELKIIRSYFYEEKLNKNDFFSTANTVCNKLSIVQNGILRVYALSDEGKEITQWISTEKFLVTDVRGFFFNEPNRWTIQAFTDLTLLTITKENYGKLCKDIPKWNEIEKRFIVKCFSMIEDRIFSHLSMSAEERYDLYFSQNKALFNQVPLQYIASVLGMSAETFSRIRKRKIENS